MNKSVVIDFFPESVQRYAQGYAVVSVDVIRATTTAITAVVLGRRVFPVPTLEAAQTLSERLKGEKLKMPLLVGELGGNKPFGFDLTNSPVEIARNKELHRPVILLATSGTSLIHETRASLASFVACFRNYSATAEYLSRHYERVAIIGAGSRGEFREEDQMCCAWIAELLITQGYTPENYQTRGIIDRWKGVSPQACYASKSVGYLKKTRQMKDLQFILTHVDDVKSAFIFVEGELVEVPVTPREALSRDGNVSSQHRVRVSHQ